MSLKATSRYLLIATVAYLVTACGAGENDPGRVFMPDMFYSRAYETYDASPLFADSMGSRMPVAGSIPRGFLPYQNENTTEGYEASSSLTNPVAYSDQVLAEGGRLYNIYCAVCHGPTGTGDGSITQFGAYPPPPAYSVRLATITEGQMFHSITHGRNLMGPYASQLTPNERWMVIYYILKLGAVGPFANGGTPATAIDTIQTAAGTGITDTTTAIMADTISTNGQNL